jgi:hypothetical protein
MRVLISTACSLVVVYLTHSFVLSLISFLAVWLTEPNHHTPSAERRYRMRMTEKRNHERS